MSDFEPTLALALHDLLPVTAAAAAMVVLIKVVGAQWTAGVRVFTVGAVLVVSAGLSKATGKVISALTGEPAPVLLDEALFPLLAGGMLVAAAAVAAAAGSHWWRSRVGPMAVGLLLATWGLALALGVSAGWDLAKVVLIGLATLGNVALAVALIRWSRSVGSGGAAVLFAANLMIVIGLAGLARAVEQTVSWQWVEQNVNLGGQLAFLVASVWLLRAVVGAKDPSPSVDLPAAIP